MSVGEKNPRIRTRAAKAKNGGVGDEEQAEVSRDRLITDLSELSIGMKLEAMDKYGKWYVAKVMEIEEAEKEVLVHFEKWSSRYDEFIPLNSGRLHFISQNKQEEMEKEKEKIKKQLTHGDRIQAKWTNGRMYYGTVVKLNDGDVDLLFDDGITYTAPLSHVRKRLNTQPPLAEKTDTQTSTAEERRFRAEKRKRNKSSPSPCTSPAGSNTKRLRLDLDSSTKETSSSRELPTRTHRSSALAVAASETEREKRKEKVVDGGEEGGDGDRNSGGVEEGVAIPGTTGNGTSGQGERIEEGSAVNIGRHTVPEDKEEGNLGTSEVAFVGQGGDNVVLEGKEEEQAAGDKVPDLISGEQGGANQPSPLPAEEKQLPQVYKKQLLKVQHSTGAVSGAVSGALEEESMGKPKRRSKRVADKCVEEKQGERKTERRNTRSKAKKEKEENINVTTGVEDESGKLQHSDTAKQEDRVEAQHNEERLGHCKDDVDPGLEEMDMSESVGENLEAPVESGSATLETVVSEGSTNIKSEQESAPRKVTEDTPSEPTEPADMETDSPGLAPEILLTDTSKEVGNSDQADGAESAVADPQSALPEGDKPEYSSDLNHPDTKSQQQINKKESSSAKPALRSRRTAGGSDPRKKSVSVVTRTRSHTSSVSEKDKSEGMPSSPGSWDHNEYKCKHAGCSKSFRKSTLLASHVKHYHPTAAAKMSKYKKSPAGKATSKVSVSQASVPMPEGATKTCEPGSSSMEEATPQATPLVEPGSSDLQHSQSAASSSMVSAQSALSSSDKITVTPKSSKTTSKSTKAGQKGDSSRKSELSKKLEGSKKSDTPKKGDGSKKHVTGTEVVSIARMSLKGLPPGSGRSSGSGQKDVLYTSSTSTVTTTTVSSTSSHSSHKQSVIVDATGLLLSSKKEEAKQSTDDEESPDDVVHCICGSNVDEGFMIQCEECLCWQHGDCVGIRSDSLPKKYTCYICVNPPGIRTRLKYKYSHDWYGEGTLPSVPGGTHFPAAQAKAVLVSHELKDSLYRVKKMMHGTDVKLQAASNPQHPYLKQWGKECSHYDKSDMVAYSVRQLAPVVKDWGVIKGAKKEGGLATGESTERLSSEVKRKTGAKEETMSPSTLTVKPVSVCDAPSSDFSSSAAGISAAQEKTVGSTSAPLPSQPSSSVTSTAVQSTSNSIKLSPVASSSPSTFHQSSTAASIVPADPRRTPQKAPATDLQSSAAESSVKVPQEELMEIMNQDEFGVSEVPVFAVDPNRIQQSVTTVAEDGTAPPSVPVVAASAVSLVLGGSSSATSSSSNFSPSSKSAFKPVAGSKSSPPKLTPATAPATTSTSSSASHGQVQDVSKPKPLNSVSPLSGAEPVTIGEFSEAFLKGDKTNWFRRMKLLDHIEEVQENMAAWLGLIEKKLADLPDNNAESTGKALADLQSSLLKLRPSKMTA